MDSGVFPLVNKLKKKFEKCNDEEWEEFCLKYGIDNYVFKEYSYMKSVEYFKNYFNNRLNQQGLFNYLSEFGGSNVPKILSELPTEKERMQSSKEVKNRFLNRFMKYPLKKRQSLTIQYGLLYGDFIVFEDEAVNETEEERITELMDKSRTDIEYIAAVNVSENFITGVLHDDDIIFYLKCEYKLQLYKLEYNSNSTQDEFTKKIRSFIYNEDKKVEDCFNRFIK